MAESMPEISFILLKGNLRLKLIIRNEIRAQSVVTVLCLSADSENIKNQFFWILSQSILKDFNNDRSITGQLQFFPENKVNSDLTLSEDWQGKLRITTVRRKQKRHETVKRFIGFSP